MLCTLGVHVVNMGCTCDVEYRLGVHVKCGVHGVYIWCTCCVHGSVQWRTYDVVYKWCIWDLNGLYIWFTCRVLHMVYNGGHVVYMYNYIVYMWYKCGGYVVCTCNVHITYGVDGVYIWYGVNYMKMWIHCKRGEKRFYPLYTILFIRTQ